MSETLLDVLLAGYLACTATLSLYGLNCLWMMRLFVTARERQTRADQALLAAFAARGGDAVLPVVTTQIPLYNEKYVAERVIRAVCAFDYPPGRHEVQVLDDSTDETRELVAALVKRLRAEGHDVHHVVRDRREGFKAGALAHGLTTARGEYIAIFDADFVPGRNFLRETVPFLMTDERCGFVQTRWGHLNRDDSQLTRALAIGIDGHFVIEQSARAWNGLFLNFNGTAGVWRRQAIADAGGWSADTVTEDLALSYRAQLKGWHGRFLFDVVTPAELPADLNDLKAQQRRWAKGSIQTALKLLPKVLAANVGLHRKLQAVLHLSHYLVHPLMVAMTLFVLPLLVYRGGSVVPDRLYPLLSLVLLALVAPSWLYAYSQRVANVQPESALRSIPVLVALGAGLAVNNSVGVLSALLSRESGVFVRTPKRGAHGSATASDYRTRLSATAALEAVMAAYAFAALWLFLERHKLLVSPVLALQVLGYVYVAFTSLWHDRSATAAAAASTRR